MGGNAGRDRDAQIGGWDLAGGAEQGVDKWFAIDDFVYDFVQHVSGGLMPIFCERSTEVVMGKSIVVTFIKNIFIPV
ncbi:hypothetical protein [Acidithiobacillus caldus]|jgi:hypothetical protein|uniref:Uncharacterized protein n=1 Tax=Acidithiobacillus caldus TaxID=33059 RepID=A0A1E7YQ92_9PROT|nr:hypothetical protein [Acidithiobacillus caldus]MBU2730855.1 hypothetical protein [Acidithiobacillus caldus]MBU2736549.1 hypothetical protein [Acidithiobacillus caldus ATCC 51756]MBU2745340.1 hypothetical protein [Acidithiobacillus caldus]MBU2779063.1 hypothetical protein [Acidithiobacillus caldus]OFC35269.1 hypothetical protein BAE28_10755 [Acidithiobacillus caldus]